MIEFIKHHVALCWTKQIGESYNKICIIHAAVVMPYASCTNYRCNFMQFTHVCTFMKPSVRSDGSSRPRVRREFCSTCDT